MRQYVWNFELSAKEIAFWKQLLILQYQTVACLIKVCASDDQTSLEHFSHIIHLIFLHQQMSIHMYFKRIQMFSFILF